MVQEKLRPTVAINTEDLKCNQDAGCVFALITDQRSVSRRNRASWYLRQLNKVVKCKPVNELEQETSSGLSLLDKDNTENSSVQESEEGEDIDLVSVIGSFESPETSDRISVNNSLKAGQQQFLVTPNTKVLFLSRSVAVSLVLDLSPSVVSVNTQNECVFLDSMFDALKRVLHLLVKDQEVPAPRGTMPYILKPKVFISVIAYTPFVVAKNNQVLVQNRRISSSNIEQVLVELWISLNRVTQEIHELVSFTYLSNLDFETNQQGSSSATLIPQRFNEGVIRHPGSVLEDIYELGLFSSSLMPRLSRLSLVIISDGLFASSNNLSIFRLKSIAVSFISLGSDAVSPDACFGYTPYVDLMKFVAKTTLGVHLNHIDLIKSSHNWSKAKQIQLISNPFYKLFSWTIHSVSETENYCNPSKITKSHLNEVRDEKCNELSPSQGTRFFCFDQPTELDQTFSPIGKSDSSRHSFYDWRSFRQLERNLDADFEHVLSCLLREGYLIKNIQFKQKETTRIIARLVLHYRHNLDLEQELTAPFWSSTDPFEISGNNQLIMRPLNTLLYGDTHCEVIVLGSYSFLHNLYCEKKSSKRKSEFRDLAHRQFRQLIDGVLQTHERLQYLSRFYRDPSLSKVPSFLSHGNSLLYEQPHTHRLTSTIDNVTDERKTSEFQEYWQKISCLDTKSWKNLMHIHTVRLVLDHDQPKHKNIHYQNANGRYTHVQCRRALSAISCFIKEYSSFALLEDTTYVKFISNNDDYDLRDIETSATKGFVVIRINKLLPIIVIYLMFTSGILDSHRVKIVSFLEEQLTNCKLPNAKASSAIQLENIFKSKTISSAGESCCVLIKSPLERMLKVYSRNFVNDCLMNNWSHGLPGSCPYTLQQSLKVSVPNLSDSYSQQKFKSETEKDSVAGYNSDNSISRYNLIFGKYLYGIRVIRTISNLPHDVVPSLAANVLSKISAILVNLRIKQGFYIAFNNSGILNLVVELDMKDLSNENHHTSSCLCQYIVFPPTVTSCPQSIHAGLSTHTNGVSSKPCSLSGSLANSENLMINTAESAQQVRVDDGEIKIIKEYWIEQQYGISSQSKKYHPSLEQKRYSELVDYLYITDSSIFECLFTYDLLKLLCDKLSLFYDLDSSFSCNDLTIVSSPTTSTSSPNQTDKDNQESNPILPSNLIDGNTRDESSKVPLIELEYKFSVVKFLEFCQLACLNILLFRGGIENDDTNQVDTEANLKRKTTNTELSYLREQQVSGLTKDTTSSFTRKMSVDVNDFEADNLSRREHRSSYQSQENQNAGFFTYFNNLYSSSLNYMFLETLHKRLKQMHDKELKLSEVDRENLSLYLKQRIVSLQKEKMQVNTGDTSFEEVNNISESFEAEKIQSETTDKSIEWRCHLRKGNQENLMIVILPATLSDVKKWLKFINFNSTKGESDGLQWNFNHICPIFVFRCSSSIINDHVLSFLKSEGSKQPVKLPLEADIMLNFGQPYNYLGSLQTSNCELTNEVLPLNQCGLLNQNASSDEKTLEVVHFKAFLRKIKNTILKSRFNSLNDAYLSELFIHKDDILYYINNVDSDTQKKYHVSSQLKSLADFIKSYEEYTDSLPDEPEKACNPLLNSILLQKCGLFINQPIARYNESSPLVRQMHDKKLLFFMRCNYKIELPLLEENLAGSTLLRKFIKQSSLTGSSGISNPNYVSHHHHHHHHALLSTSISETKTMVNGDSTTSPSLSKSEGTRLMEMKFSNNNSSSISGTVNNSPNVVYSMDNNRSRIQQAAPRFSSTSTLSSMPSSISDSSILEVFKNYKSCSMEDVQFTELADMNDICLRHEAHMAEVLRRTSERKESHHYRRVLKSKGNYNQSHGAIDQALRRVDSLGRFEHFCLTPLLFSPSWRSKLAPVRDHTIESGRLEDSENHYLSSINGFGSQNNKTVDGLELRLAAAAAAAATESSPNDIESQLQQQMKTNQQLNEDRWHQTVCNNYIKEYEQYIQTLGFNSVQIKYQSSSKSSAGLLGTNTTTAQSSLNASALSKPSSRRRSRNSLTNSRFTSARSNAGSFQHNNSSPSNYNRINSLIGTATNSLPGSGEPMTAASSSSNSTSYTTGYNYLIKFLNSGCLVFKVGFCKPYVYSILYSIEGERFNNSNTKMNMTTFLDELDNIKVTMHLHSFTYDYHLRSMYSYISGRQLTFSPCYHLISFLDEFRKYYQKAPNYARNHILSDEISISNTKVSGQQLYNYIVTHNSAYNMQVLEMSPNITNLLSSLSGNSVIEDQKSQDAATANGASNLIGDSLNLSRNHANDYVLIELKREKVYYRDGKDPDVFDCGLLISHDIEESTEDDNNCLTLKYFLLLTNQRDLYPKLIHTYDNIISSGCHRPIRLGVTEQKPANQLNQKEEQLDRVSSTTTGPSSGQSDLDDINSSISCELQSSGEISGPQSILSTANSIQSSSSGILRELGVDLSNIGILLDKTSVESGATTSDKSSTSSSVIHVHQKVPKIKLEESEDVKYEPKPSSKFTQVNSLAKEPDALIRDHHETTQMIVAATETLNQTKTETVHLASSSMDDDEESYLSDETTLRKRIPRSKRDNSQTSNTINTGTSSNNNNNRRSFNTNQERTICDEEITYLGYFSSDEMDMLKFLQEKTVNLRAHIEEVVRLAEIHYQRDYLWHKLMQRQHSPQSSGNSSGIKSDELPLTNDELLQLLAIIETVDLSTLDPQLSIFLSMNTTWYMKLLKSFADLKQASSNQHRIYNVKSQSRFLLLYIDPKCTTAFILFSFDPDRGSAQLDLLFKDKQDCVRSNEKVSELHQSTSSPSTSSSIAKQQSGSMGESTNMDLDQDCQQLINDFVNFCACFMWSTFFS